MSKYLLNAILLLLSTLTFAQADDSSLARYDLKIFDYKLGMTYDEAISVRAFHYTTYPGEGEAIGFVNSAYIEDVEFNTAVYFADNRAYKIIGRFNPKNHEQILNTLKKALGQGVERSKSFQAVNGTEITQRICNWIFPGARIDLVYMSNNSEFATLSMISSSLGESSAEN